ncbi:hypothetical protein [Rubellicoccus peritrichatus]|uniref:Uncharacterized protein n=1 Tax=Rubellicoccus peritrichatus TaxID=3080537 RepID=A0AAQ3LHI2_9BACT|nr:hypothetical protein [Puniceicoccus sp. CR14]WOO42184.1 hypothetical protein RZN69_03720 [Puniceicoccus sp. CR14]
MFLALIAPVFIIFDLVQLVIAERYIGIKQIRDGLHPLESGKVGPAWMAVIWVGGAFAYKVYMLILVFSPQGALQGFIMLLATLAGFAFRRTLGLKYALVILTLEASVRMGLLVNFMISVFLWEGRYLPPSFYQ